MACLAIVFELWDLKSMYNARVQTCGINLCALGYQPHTHRHTDTQTHRHTDTDTRTRTTTHPPTHTHTNIHTQNNTFFKRPFLPLLTKTPLKSGNCLSPHFLGNSTLYCFLWILLLCDGIINSQFIWLDWNYDEE